MTDGPAPLRCPVTDASLVPEARRMAQRAAAGCGLPRPVVDQVALAATELAENLHRHAVGGQLIVLPDADTLNVLAVDRGPGVRRFDRCLVDGYSTPGSLGAGLGAVRRLATGFEAVSEPGRGTVVLARFGAAPRAVDVDVAGLGFPIAGESVNGDAWGVCRHGSRLILLLADGLGHSEQAAAASRLATAALSGLAGLPLNQLLRALHDRLHGSRGAAVTIASLEVTALRRGGPVDSAGLGNVAILLAAPDGGSKRIPTQHGTAGATAPSAMSTYSSTIAAGGVIVLHTDGLTSRFDLAGRAELLRHSALLVAAALLRDHDRGSDDTGVLVARAVGGLR